MKKPKSHKIVMKMVIQYLFNKITAKSSETRVSNILPIGIRNGKISQA